MSILEKLIEVICLAEGIDEQTLNESILNEKITTKKALRRKRRQQRKLAKKQAEQQAQEQETEEQTQEEEQTNEPSTALIVYDANAGVEETPQDYSEAFKKFNELYNAILNKYSPVWEQAKHIWEQAGKDKPCPQEAYDLLKQTIQECAADVKSLIDNQLPQLMEEMYVEELDYVDYQLTAMNGFLEKKSELIDSIHPELVVDQEEVEKIDGETTPELQTGADLLALPDKSKQQKQDTRKKTKLLTYDVWSKSDSKMESIWNGITNAAKRLSQLPFADFLKGAVQGVAGWFEEGLWKIINSPLAKDIVMAIMYTNPITAALFDGYIANFGIKEGLDKLRNKRQEKAAKQKQEQENETNKKYNKRGILQNVDGLKWNKLKREFYGNKKFVDLVNLCFNHNEVDKKDKADVRKYTKKVDIIFKKKEKAKIDEARKNFNSLLNTLNKICDYMEWDDSNNIINVIKTWNSKRKGNVGNTNKELQDIKNAGKKKDQEQSGTIDYNKLAQAIVKAQGGETK